MKTKIKRMARPLTYEVRAWVGDVRARELVTLESGSDPVPRNNQKVQDAWKRVRAKVRRWIRG